MSQHRTSSGLVLTPQMSHARAAATPSGSAPTSARSGRVTNTNIATRLSAAKTREERTALLMAQQRPGLSDLSCVPVRSSAGLNSSYTSGKLLAGPKRIPAWGVSDPKTPSLAVSERERHLPHDVRRWTTGDYADRGHMKVTDRSLAGKASDGVKGVLVRTPVPAGQVRPMRRPQTAPHTATQRDLVCRKAGGSARPSAGAAPWVHTGSVKAAPHEELGALLTPRMGRRKSLAPPPDHVTRGDLAIKPAEARAQTPKPFGRATPQRFNRSASNPVTHEGERDVTPLRGRVSKELISDRAARAPKPELPQRPGIGATQRTRHTPIDAGVFASKHEPRTCSVRRVLSASPVRAVGANPNSSVDAPGLAAPKPRGVRPVAAVPAKTPTPSGIRVRSADTPPLAPRPTTTAVAAPVSPPRRVAATAAAASPRRAPSPTHRSSGMTRTLSWQ